MSFFERLEQTLELWGFPASIPSSGVVQCRHHWHENRTERVLPRDAPDKIWRRYSWTHGTKDRECGKPIDVAIGKCCKCGEERMFDFLAFYDGI